MCIQPLQMTNYNHLNIPLLKTPRSTVPLHRHMIPWLGTNIEWLYSNTNYTNQSMEEPELELVLYL